MGKPVLILNGDYQPLSRYPLSLNSMKKVLKSLLKGRFDVVKEYDDTIKVYNKVIKLPKIVALKRYISVSHTPKFSRKNVYLRDNYTCQYCGQQFKPDELTFDHVIPKCKGGQTNWENIVTACKTCNGRKGGKTLDEAHMTLINKPFIPSTRHLENMSMKRSTPSYSDWFNDISWEKEMEG